MRERGPALVLVGFMGTGKSSVGRAIARRLSLPRFDTDELVAARFGMPVSQIFAQHGEAHFRNAESDVLRQIGGSSEAVIVTGGGIVLRAENVEHLQRVGTVVALSAREEVIFERISRRASRPLLQTANPRETITSLLAMRAPLYAAAADAQVDTSNLTHAEAADAVIEHWNALRTASSV